MESFWGSMQIELLNRQSWKTVLELSSAMANWIDNFYNPLRRHSSLSYVTPTNTRPYTHDKPRPHSRKRGPPKRVNHVWSGRRDSNPRPQRPERCRDGLG